MTVVRRTLARGSADEGVGPENLNYALLRERYFFEQFMIDPLCNVKGSLTEPAGTSLESIVVRTGRYAFEYAFIGDATDAFVPVLATDGGYNWVMTTATLDRGVEINFGGLREGHPRNFTPSSEDWFFRVLMILDNASGADVGVLFRKVASAYGATPSDYTDFFGIRMLGDSSSALGAFSVMSALNNPTDWTNTAITGTLTDATLVELEVQSVARKGKVFINGVQQNYGTAFTFDSGDRMSPVLRLIQTTDTAAQIKTLCAEGGPLACRQKGLLNALSVATT